MSVSPPKQGRHRDGGFQPVNTLSSKQSPRFTIFDESQLLEISKPTMVNERLPPSQSSGANKPQLPTDEWDAPRIPAHLQSRPQLPASAQQNAQAPQPTVSRVNALGGPEFGKASPLRNPLKPASIYANNATNPMFNVPKHGRPEHHRPIHRPNLVPKPFTDAKIAPVKSSASASQPQEQPPPRQPTTSEQQLPPLPDVFQISPPQPPTYANIPAAPKPVFSSQGFQSVNAWKAPAKTTHTFIDLTTRQPQSRPDDGFNPDKALSESPFGAYDPYSYLDTAQTSENIKALLEGAFEEDEDDKPKMRLRRRRQRDDAEEQSAVDQLASDAKKLHVDERAEGVKSKADAVEDDDEEDDGTVEGLSVKLLPHQIDGVAWMMDKEVGKKKKNGVLPKGGILADDMGLGKTIQALSLILMNSRPENNSKEAAKLKVPEEAGKGTLVVAPLALIKQWEAEIKDKVEPLHKLKVIVHHGASRTRRAEDLKKYDVVITTYETLVSEHGDSSESEGGLKVGVMGVYWYRIILDEAHKIKNRNAKMTKGAYALKSLYRWCLTGTPMQNNLDELQSLICFLRIKPYNDMKQWKDQIGGPMKNGRGGLAMKRLQYFLKAFMKRRTKDVLKKEGGLSFGKKAAGSDDKSGEGFKIVARKVEAVEVEFDEQEQGFYDRLAARTEKTLESMAGGGSNYMGALVLLLRLRQTCNHPELIRGNLRKDKDTFVTPQAAGKAPSEVDDLANMLGGMSVETRVCDVCQTQLPGAAAASGAVRCIDCEEDLVSISRDAHKSTESKGKQVAAPKKTGSRSRARRRVIESEGEGDDDCKTSDGASDSEVKYFSSSDDDEQDVEEDDEQDNERDGDGDDTSALATVSSTKIRKLLEILDKEAPEHKVIVFSEFTSMLDLVEPFLRTAKHKFVRYDGSMKNDDREASLHALRNSKSVRVLLCSLKCGSLGLNLTAASRVVILEPFWNPFVEEQAIDRVHRLNQTQDVVVYKLTVRNTVEERILALQQKKRELANAALEGGKAGAKLSMQDILQLFRRDAESDPLHEHTNAPGFQRARVLDGTGTAAIAKAVNGFGGYGSDAFSRRW